MADTSTRFGGNYGLGWSWRFSRFARSSIEREQATEFHPPSLQSDCARRPSELNPHALKSPTKNPTLYPTNHSDSIRRDRHHRTGNSEDSSRFRHHETIPTVCSHLIIPWSWVRCPTGPTHKP